MKIVVLDGFTLNPGDLDWTALRKLGDCEIFDRTPATEVADRAQGADILLTNKALVTGETIAALPDLRYIGVLATGINVVDAEAARARGIPVANVPGYSTPSVAQTVFALLLELTNQVGHHARAVRDGRWTDCADFTFRDTPLVELSGLTMGLVGYGAIAQAVARIARSFEMNVLINTRRGGDSAEFVSLEELFARSDVVSLHCPLTPDTKELVNAQTLAWMKPGAFLINTARGPVIDEAALAAALNDGGIGGAGLDVLSSEPPAAGNPLLHAKNCIVTPHYAWATRAARQRLLEKVVGNVRAFLEGNPRNVVN